MIRIITAFKRFTIFVYSLISPVALGKSLFYK